MPENLSKEEKWVLRLIYAPNNPSRDHDTWIYGRTRLMKAVFLLDRHLKEEFGRETGFDFRPHKYGPYADELWQTVLDLSEKGLLVIVEGEEPEQSVEKIQLTNRGTDIARQLWRDTASEVREMVTWLKYRHISQSLHSLLSFVYNEYPSMATNSEIADDYLA